MLHDTLYFVLTISKTTKSIYLYVTYIRKPSAKKNHSRLNYTTYVSAQQCGRGGGTPCKAGRGRNIHTEQCQIHSDLDAKKSNCRYPTRPRSSAAATAASYPKYLCSRRRHIPGSKRANKFNADELVGDKDCEYQSSYCCSRHSQLDW